MKIKWRTFIAGEVLEGEFILTELVPEAWRYFGFIANSSRLGDA